MVLANRYKALLERAEVNTPLRLAHFFAQIDHESGLKPISENLNYSAKGLRLVFSKYFKTDLEAKKYERKPREIANKVYANRMGNGDELSGDGWRYRGRGFIQLTGKDNYRAFSEYANKPDYITDPDMLLNESDAMVCALWFWSKNKLNTYADKDDIYTITRRINGGLNGIEHRKELLKKYKSEFKNI